MNPMKVKDISDAWARIRKIDQTIPDEVLDLMKDAAIAHIRNQNAENNSNLVPVLQFITENHWESLENMVFCYAQRGYSFCEDVANKFNALKSEYNG